MVSEILNLTLNLNMAQQLVLLLAVLVTVGTGLIAGVFFAFSTFVMRALDQLGAVAAVSTMQSINVLVINPWFLGTFFGSAILSLALTFVAPGHPGYVFFVGAAISYVGGTFLVTVVANVPLNNRLAAMSAHDASATLEWDLYLSRLDQVGITLEHCQRQLRSC